MKRSPFISQRLDHQLKLYAAKGGKTSRKATVRRVRRFIDECQRPAEQIGRRQVYEFFEKNRFSSTTQRDYYYAVALLWRMLGRSGEPPHPRDCTPPSS